MNSRQTDDNRRKSQSTATPRSTSSRRHLLQSVGSVVVIGAVAGCVNGRTNGSDGDSNGDGETSVSEWLSKTENYDSVRGLTERDSVTISVGARGNAGKNAFAPAAIEIDPGTTVTWNWVDGYHNVVATGGQFESGSPERNATFEYTFESAGTFRYYCGPHKSIEMKGAVVTKEPTDGAESE